MTAAAMETVWAPPTTEIKRDRWSRPYITPPGSDKPVAYQRMTTFINVLEDRINLEKWGKRMVGVGLQARQDLLFGITPHTPVLSQPHGATGDRCICGAALNRYGDCSEEKSAKAAVDDLVQQALDAASAQAKANIGTAWHAIAQKHDEGKDPGLLAPEHARALDNYRRATESWSWLHIEQLMVLDEYAVAGTPDRIADIPGLGRVVVDIKTGASTLRFGMATVAMQLAGYANSLLYNHETGQRAAVDGLSTDVGLVVALHPFSGEVELHTVDIAAGWEACGHAAWVRGWRKRKDLHRLWQPGPVLHADYPDPATLAGPTPEGVSAGIRQCLSREALLGLWKSAAASGSWTEQHTAEAKARLEDIEGDQRQLEQVRKESA